MGGGDGIKCQRTVVVRTCCSDGRGQGVVLWRWRPLKLSNCKTQYKLNVKNICYFQVLMHHKMIKLLQNVIIVYT